MCNLVKNDYQHLSKVLFSFVRNKQFGQLINMPLHSLTMRNTFNTELSFVEVWFIDQASKALEIEDNFNLTLIIGQSLVQQNQDLENTLKDMVFCHLQENLVINMVKN